MTKILVIGDSHIEVGEPIQRYKWLSNYILEKRPEVIVSIGDFLTLDCLSSWDKNNRKKMEGKRYMEEIKLGRKALDYLFSMVVKYNNMRRRHKKETYKPRFVFIEGNHEYRLTRYINQNPELEGTMDVGRDLGLELMDAHWVPYHGYFEINGIYFMHVPFNKGGRPVGGNYVARRALDMTNKSVVFGHTHKLVVENIHRTGGEHLQQALNVGCFFEHQPDYVAGAPSDYWRGVCMLNNYDPQRFDLETVSLSRLRRQYG